MIKIFIIIFSFYFAPHVFSAESAPCGDYGECDNYSYDLYNNESLQKGGYPNKQNAELYLVHLMFSDKELALKIKEKVKVEDFIDPNLRQIVELCYRLLAENCELRIDLAMNQIDEPNIKNLLSEIGVTTISFDNPKQTVRDCVNAINKKTHAQQVEELKKQRNEALVAGESERSQKIQNKLEELRMNQLRIKSQA